MSSLPPDEAPAPYYFVLFSDDEFTDEEEERWVIEGGDDTEAFMKKLKEVEEKDPDMAQQYMMWFMCAQVEGVDVAQSESGLYQYGFNEQGDECTGEIWDVFGDPCLVMWRATIDRFLSYCREHSLSGVVYRMRA